MRRVFIASGISEAQLVRQMLETAGVCVQVLNEHASGGLGELPATEAWPEIWVEREHQLAHARSLIRDYESASDWTGGMIPFDWGLQYDHRGYVLISEISTGVYVVQFDGDINPEICVNSGVNCEFVCKNGNYDS